MKAPFLLTKLLIVDFTKFIFVIVLDGGTKALRRFHELFSTHVDKNIVADPAILADFFFEPWPVLATPRLLEGLQRYE